MKYIMLIIFLSLSINIYSNNSVEQRDFYWYYRFIDIGYEYQSEHYINVGLASMYLPIGEVLGRNVLFGLNGLDSKFNNNNLYLNPLSMNIYYPFLFIPKIENVTLITSFNIYDSFFIKLNAFNTKLEYENNSWNYDPSLAFGNELQVYYLTLGCSYDLFLFSDNKFSLYMLFRFGGLTPIFPGM